VDTPAQSSGSNPAPVGHFTCFHVLLVLALLVGVVTGGRIGWARGGWVGLILVVLAAIPLTILAALASVTLIGLLAVAWLRRFDPEALRMPASEPRDTPSGRS
jgi:hypothetical protein